jgi:hypothetical protein
MKEIVLRDQLRREVTFPGELVFETSTDDEGPRLRWVEFALYRHGEGGYVLDRIGQSVVYHRVGGCDRGVLTDVKSLPGDAEPCDRCLQRYTGSPVLEQVKLEEVRHTINRCQTAEEVVQALTLTRGPGKTPFLSAPARGLLEGAAQKDDGIRQATTGSRISI